MATRTITETIRKPDGTAWAGAKVHFRLRPSSFDSGVHYPGRDVAATANADGLITAVLWANEDGDVSSTYTVELPDGDTFEITVPAGSATSLSLLRAAGVTSYDPQYSTILAWLQGRWRSDWSASPSPAYQKGQVVYHDFSSWIALLDGATDEPATDSDEWEPIAIGTDLATAEGYVTAAQAAASTAAQDAVDEIAGFFEGLTLLGKDYLPDVYGVSEVVARLIVTAPGTIPANFGGSAVRAEVAATGTPAASIKIHAGGVGAGTEFGTWTWAAAGTVPTLATSGGATQALAVGDIVSITMPATPDSTLAGVAFALSYAI